MRIFNFFPSMQKAMSNYSVGKKFIRKFIFWTPILQFVMLTCTMIAGFAALSYYKNANRAAVNNTLMNMDDRIYDAISPETLYLYSALYFDVSGDLNAKQKADAILNSVAGDSINLNWTTIPELYNAIMSLGRYPDNLDKFYRLLSGISFSERALLLAYRAYCQYKFGIITKRDWNDYKAYILDFSKSPLFLCALHINYKEGFIDDNFAKEIQRIFIENRIPLVDEFYTEAKNKSWIKRRQK